MSCYLSKLWGHPGRSVLRVPLSRALSSVHSRAVLRFYIESGQSPATQAQLAKGCGVSEMLKYLPVAMARSVDY